MLFDYILSQLRGVESELMCNQDFNNWEELKVYLTEHLAKLMASGEGEFQFIKQDYVESVKKIVTGLKGEQFRFALSTELLDSLEEVWDQIKKWEFIPGYATPSSITMPSRTINNVKVGCYVCATKAHNLDECPAVKNFVDQRKRQGKVADRQPMQGYSEYGVSNGVSGRNGIYRKPYPGNYVHRNDIHRYPQNNYYQGGYQRAQGQSNNFQARYQSNAGYQGNNAGYRQMQNGRFHQKNYGRYPRGTGIQQNYGQANRYNRTNVRFGYSNAAGNQQTGINTHRPEISGYVNNGGTSYLPFINFTINGLPARAIIDTGASVSLIRNRDTRGIMSTDCRELTGIGGMIECSSSENALILSDLRASSSQNGRYGGRSFEERFV